MEMAWPHPSVAMRFATAVGLAIVSQVWGAPPSIAQTTTAPTVEIVSPEPGGASVEVSERPSGGYDIIVRNSQTTKPLVVIVTPASGASAAPATVTIESARPSAPDSRPAAPGTPTAPGTPLPPASAGPAAPITTAEVRFVGTGSLQSRTPIAPLSTDTSRITFVGTGALAARTEINPIDESTTPITFRGTGSF
jgi:hypothetical protein